MRLFIGLPVPELAAGELEGRVQQASPRWSPSARLTGAADLHLTLRFLGETDPGRLAELSAALAEALARVRCGVLEVQLTGVAVFRGAGAIFAEVQAPEALFGLEDALSESLAWRGVPRERRSFHPHITLARRRHGLPQAELDRWNASWLPMAVPLEELVLFQSVSGPGQAGGRYQRLRGVRLDGGVSTR